MYPLNGSHLLPLWTYSLEIKQDLWPLPSAPGDWSLLRASICCPLISHWTWPVRGTHRDGQETEPGIFILPAPTLPSCLTVVQAFPLLLSCDPLLKWQSLRGSAFLHSLGPCWDGNVSLKPWCQHHRVLPTLYCSYNPAHTFINEILCSRPFSKMCHLFPKGPSLIRSQRVF